MYPYKHLFSFAFMGTTTWTFGAEESDFYVTVTFDGTNKFTVSCIEGALDLNALWFSDGDGSGGEGGVTLPKNDRALSMDGTKVKWDAYAKLSSPGLKKGQTLDSKITYLTAGDTETYTLDDLNTGWITNWNDITLGLRATSVIGVLGTTSIKYVATPDAPQPDYDWIVVGQDGSGNPLYWGDVDEDGQYDAGDVLLSIDENGLLSESDSGDPIDYTAKDWTVVFQAINSNTTRPTPDPVLDLAGFAETDKLVIDFTAIQYMGIRLGNQKASALQPPTTASRFEIFSNINFPNQVFGVTKRDTINATFSTYLSVTVRTKFITFAFSYGNGIDDSGKLATNLAYSTTTPLSNYVQFILPA